MPRFSFFKKQDKDKDAYLNIIENIEGQQKHLIKQYHAILKPISVIEEMLVSKGEIGEKINMNKKVQAALEDTSTAQYNAAIADKNYRATISTMQTKVDVANFKHKDPVNVKLEKLHLHLKTVYGKNDQLTKRVDNIISVHGQLQNEKFKYKKTHVQNQKRWNAFKNNLEKEVVLLQSSDGSKEVIKKMLSGIEVLKEKMEHAIETQEEFLERMIKEHNTRIERAELSKDMFSRTSAEELDVDSSEATIHQPKTK